MKSTQTKKVRPAHRALLLACVLCLICAVSCSKSAGIDFDYKAVQTEGRVVASAGSDISFDYDSERNVFTLTDARQGKVWSNEMTDEYYGNANADNEYLANSKRQLFTLTYIDEYDSATAVESSEAELTAEPADGGVTIKCVIPETPITFDLRLRVENNTLIACIPENSLAEDETHRLLSIDLFPFMGASVDTQDGYVLFPDGAGALYDFKEKSAGMNRLYTVNIFGNYFTSLDDCYSDASAGKKWPMLPVFGVKHGDSAFAAVITSGQADTALCLAPSGYIYSATRVYPVFNYRYSCNLQAVNDEEVTIFEKERSHGDFEIQYTFLSGEVADYSGMAASYRSYLLKNNLLNRSDTPVNLSVDVLTSIKKPMLLWEQTVVPTSFSQTSEIVTALAAISGTRINLLGWQKGGYNVYPSHFPVSGAAGGQSVLEKLIRQAETQGSTISLSDNFFEADSKASGFSARSDCVYNISNELLAAKDNTKHILDFRTAYKSFTGSWQKSALDVGVKGVNLDQIGRLVYQNGAKYNPLRRGEAAKIAGAMLEQGGENFETLGSGGGNEYVLKHSDFLYSIPQSSSKSFVFTRDVPFFQMVVHGYIPYTAEIPGNLSDDFTMTRLLWADYGYVPYFSVSYSDASVLKDCYSSGVFVSKFADWQQRMMDTVKEFSEKLGPVANVPIVRRTEISQTLVRVDYENGAAVLINYGAEAVTQDGVNVPAASFEVLG